MSFLDQAKLLANQALSTTTSTLNTIASHPTVQQATNTVSVAASQAAEAAKPALATASTTAKGAFNTAHAQAHNLAPGVIPKPAPTGNTIGAAPGSIDSSSDLTPRGQGTDKLERLVAEHDKQGYKGGELREKGILMGDAGDALAGKRRELEGAMKKDKLDAQIQARPTPDELVRGGILKPDEVPR